MTNDKKIILFLLLIITVCIVLVSRKYLATPDALRVHATLPDKIQVQAVLLPLPVKEEEVKRLRIPGFAGQPAGADEQEKQW